MVKVNTGDDNSQKLKLIGRLIRTMDMNAIHNIILLDMFLCSCFIS
jgi:hypothetical protein